MGCCGASKKCIKLSSANALLGGIFMVAAAFSLFGTMGTIFDKVLCIVNNLNILVNLGGEYAEDADLVPQSAVDAIRTWIDLLRIIAILPACGACAFLLGSCLLGWCAKGSYCCAKVFNVFAMHSCAGGIVFYALCGIAATLVETPSVQAQISEFNTQCATTLPTLKTELDQAQAAYDAAVEAGSGDITPYKEQLDDANAGYAAFEQVCACYDDAFNELSNLTVPGFISMVASIYALLAVCILCCNENCCSKPSGAGIKPAFPPESVQMPVA